MWMTIDGKQAFAATGGRDFIASQPTTILVHGAGGDHSVWALVSRALAHYGRSVLALDLPGHGRSDGAPLSSIGAIADWLSLALNAAGVERASVIGHSMGALAALDLAARHPGRVAALGLVGAATAMPVHEDLLNAARDDIPTAIAMITSWGYSADAALGGHQAPGLWMVGESRRLLERSAAGVLHTDLAACNAYQDGERAAKAVRCPTTLIIGTADRMTPAKAGRALAASIAGSRVVELAGAGHMLMAERPDPVLDALLGV
jgi:pimeloyl-ACP methyl ester carboxylesterase